MLGVALCGLVLFNRWLFDVCLLCLIYAWFRLFWFDVVIKLGLVIVYLFGVFYLCWLLLFDLFAGFPSICVLCLLNCVLVYFVLWFGCILECFVWCCCCCLIVVWLELFCLVFGFGLIVLLALWFYSLMLFIWCCEFVCSLLVVEFSCLVVDFCFWFAYCLCLIGRDFCGFVILGIFLFWLDF